ncbi:PAS domain S-box-containing protein/diguanylate cyclase (GGDEF) domain-containing protein [Thalassobacillus cyri]|uniref:PAS domain S-box-containing protein/diguanylate cyclase (GGDEF) domain-containing protein n=1 Tax=Thalassobacillus cyri TaxID=571932 RepID=A0A1H3Z235_9BACI|nr:GGDEF and EAL domain-containing protein [Thalassobacillus cyri]SEA17501.1 PAS domain S-box-containing protein/diguanylate cyclase (GGDEF) domain-containing protein [Thalassobacillus cyri]
MNILNLDTSNDRTKFKRLLESLNYHIKDEQVRETIDELEALVHGYLNKYHDLKYAMEQALTITVTDIKGRIIYADDQFCSLTQYNRRELIGNTHRLLKSKQHPPAFYKELWSEILQGNVWNGNICNRKKSGEIFWVKTTIVPLLTAEGRPYSFIAFRSDITDAKQMEASLADQVENDFQRTVEALMNMVFKVQHHQNDYYHFTMYEGKLARDLGLTTSYVKGKKLEEIFDPVKAAYLKDKYNQAFAGEHITYKHKLKNRYLYSTLAPIRQNGEVVEIIGSSVDITVHAEAELRVRHMAYHDPLTDLPNRRKVQEDLEVKIFHAEKQETPLAIFLCDLDRFKYVNDALGHTAGDEVIQLMGARIKEAIKGKGELYRLGGDEFLVISEQVTSKKIARELGEAILDQVSKPILMMGKKFFITTSIGIAQYSGRGMTAGKLIGNADIAMHYCKLSGRQSLLFYTASMNAYYNELVSLEGDLREAISKKELMLYYQPKIDVRSGVISGMEALVRWNHPQRGFISPGKFIPIAEETGLIVQLGEWVLYEACRQNQEWIEKGYAPERVAINVSAEEIQRHEFAGRVQKVLEKTGMPAEFLEIEITENSIMQNTEACIRTMQELRRLGIALSLMILEQGTLLWVICVNFRSTT